MNKYLIIIVVFLLGFSIQAQNILNSNWKFSTGDDLSWIRPDFDDSKWTNAIIGEAWEKWGFEKYDGFAWYRKAVVIPSKLKNDAEKNGGLILKLARIDDADYTYFNGSLIGKTGELPPHYLGKYDVDRAYTIPVTSILWDQPNIIAVRVYDEAGNGGVYGTDISLMVSGAKNLFNISPTFKESNRVILGSMDIKIPIELENLSAEKVNGIVKLTLLNDFSDTISVFENNAKIGAGSKTVVSFPLKNTIPGVYLASASFTSASINKNVKFNFAYEPEKMTTVNDIPADFEIFWNRAKRELGAVDPQYKLTKVDSLSTHSRDCYLVEMRSLGNILVHAWLMTPKKPGKYPAVLTVQGYATNMMPDMMFQDDNVVSLGLNISGQGNSKDNLNPGFPGYLTYQLGDKEQFIYRGAYMDCVRAVDFLFSRTDVDTTRVAVEGGSQGGALTFATAALCKSRIRLAVPSVPFLSNFPEYIKVAPWPANEWLDFANTHPSVGLKGVLNTFSYFDIKNLAPWITADVLMGVGLMDVTCPLRINFAAYNNLKVNKKYIVFPNAGHGLPADFNTDKQQFINSKFNINSK